MTQDNNIQQLLKPRFKVIADWPDNKVLSVERVVIVSGGDLKFTERFFTAYPHLFRRLSWYVDRNPEQMPEYVKDVIRPGMVNDIYVYKVKKHYTRNMTTVDCGIKNDNKYWMDENDFSHLYEHYIPATEAEYLEYINSKKP